MAKSEEQLTLDSIPKRRGRPKGGNAKSAAERQREYRERNKKKDIIQVTRSVTSDAKSLLDEMEKKGVTLDAIIEAASVIRRVVYDEDQDSLAENNRAKERAFMSAYRKLKNRYK